MIWAFETPLILASRSATRLKLLQDVGLPVIAEVANVDERKLEGDHFGLDANGLALLLAGAKAKAVSEKHPERWVLGADQVLECERRIFHKPSDRAAAALHLKSLSGRQHTLRSALALAKNGAIVETGIETARLTMRALSEDEISAYLTMAGDVILGSVGAYQVEALGLHLFEEVEGEHSVILGLPLLNLLAMLRRQGCLSMSPIVS